MVKKFQVIIGMLLMIGFLGLVTAIGYSRVHEVAVLFSFYEVEVETALPVESALGLMYGYQGYTDRFHLTGDEQDFQYAHKYANRAANYLEQACKFETGPEELAVLKEQIANISQIAHLGEEARKIHTEGKGLSLSLYDMAQEMHKQLQSIAKFSPDDGADFPQYLAALYRSFSEASALVSAYGASPDESAADMAERNLAEFAGILGRMQPLFVTEAERAVFDEIFKYHVKYVELFRTARAYFSEAAFIYEKKNAQSRDVFRNLEGYSARAQSRMAAWGKYLRYSSESGTLLILRIGAVCIALGCVIAFFIVVGFFRTRQAESRPAATSVSRDLRDFQARAPEAGSSRDQNGANEVDAPGGDQTGTQTGGQMNGQMGGQMGTLADAQQIQAAVQDLGQVAKELRGVMENLKRR